MAYQYIECYQKNHVAYVILNRPQKMNSLNFVMFEELNHVYKVLKKDKNLRAIVIQGKGEHFCSGLDVKSVMKSPISAIRLLWKWLPGNANLAQRVSINWQRIPVPVIAVIKGHCYGGGLQIALGADFRIADTESDLSIMESKWGLLPDMAGLANLRHIMAKDQAMKLTMTSEVFNAELALKYGLVTDVTSNCEQALDELLERLLVHSPDALAAIKYSYHKNWGANIRRLLSRESWYQIQLLLGSNQRKSVYRQTKNNSSPFHPRKFK